LLDKSPFYAEQGGQEYDTGKIVIDGKAEFQVENVQVYAGYVLHTGFVEEGSFQVDDAVIAGYDELRRWPLRNNHTGTHILNFALRQVIGDGVEQKGSLVAPEKLRFDFSHKKAVELKELEEVENIVNKTVKENLKVYAQPVELEIAKGINGLRAVFGETYPNPVRVVSVGIPVDDLLADPTNEKWNNYSIEFCGGTHVAKTDDIKEFVIIEESGIAKGIRRIVAVSGTEAREVQRKADEFSKLLDDADKLPYGELKERKVKDLGTELGKLSISVVTKAELKNKFAKIEKSVKDETKLRVKQDTAKVMDAVKAHFAEPEHNQVCALHIKANANAKIVSEAINYMKKDQKDKCLYLVLGEDEGKAAQGVYLSPPVQEKIAAVDVATKGAEFIGGRAGGKGNSCQGMGDKAESADAAVAEIKTLLEKMAI
jgi:alanyl-tRNA synthetase